MCLSLMRSRAATFYVRNRYIGTTIIVRDCYPVPSPNYPLDAFDVSYRLAAAPLCCCCFCCCYRSSCCCYDSCRYSSSCCCCCFVYSCVCLTLQLFVLARGVLSVESREVFWSQALPIWLRYRAVQWRVNGLPEKEQVGATVSYC